MIFTPKNEDGTERLEMDITVISGDPYRRVLGFRGVIEDRKTGDRYRVYGAACDLPHCQCDARIKPVAGT